MTNKMQWEDGAVCYGDERQWFANTSYDNDRLELVNDDGSRKYSLYGMLNYPKDFQLNEIRTGDYIPASELDTEQKYNDVVEVFGLFGFEEGMSYRKHFAVYNADYIVLSGGFVDSVTGSAAKREHCTGRQLTYAQVMTIGQLKRMMDERENADVGLPKDRNDAVNSPSHYKFFDDIEAIEIIASSMTLEQFKGYCMGNKLKYRLRAGAKDDLQQDIDKSNKYNELFINHKRLCKTS